MLFALNVILPIAPITAVLIAEPLCTFLSREFVVIDIHQQQTHTCTEKRRRSPFSPIALSYALHSIFIFRFNNIIKMMRNRNAQQEQAK